MAGLSGYVEDGRLSAEGIECACAGLLTFRGILQTLAIDRISVFATASLRNISNTEQALSVIHAATGYFVEVISGEEEALFGYAGAMQELRLSSGAFLDIGGASTEIVTFDGGTPVNFASFPIGLAESVPPLCQENTAGGGFAQAPVAGNFADDRSQRGRNRIAPAPNRRRRYGARRAQAGTALLQDL